MNCSLLRLLLLSTLIFSLVSSAKDLFVIIARGRTGDEVRTTLRSLAVNGGREEPAHVVLIADNQIWKHLKEELITAKGLLVRVYLFGALTGTRVYGDNYPGGNILRPGCLDGTVVHCVNLVLQNLNRNLDAKDCPIITGCHNRSAILFSPINFSTKFDAIHLSLDVRLLIQKTPFLQYRHFAKAVGDSVILFSDLLEPSEGGRLSVDAVSLALSKGSIIGSYGGVSYFLYVLSLMPTPYDWCGTTQVKVQFFNIKRGEVICANKEIPEASRLHLLNPHLLSLKNHYFWNQSMEIVMARTTSSVPSPRMQICGICHDAVTKSNKYYKAIRTRYNVRLDSPLPECDAAGVHVHIDRDICIEVEKRSIHRKSNLNNIVSGSTKLPICLGIIIYEGTFTVNNTLSSFRKHGLFNMVNETIAYFQNIDTPQKEGYAKWVLKLYPEIKSHIKMQKNTWFWAFKDLADICQSKYILILEEDFTVLYEPEIIAEELNTAVDLIANGGVDAVRFRSRHDSGHPDGYLDYAINGRGKGTLTSGQWIAYVLWDEYAEDSFESNILRVCRLEPKTWCTSSAYADYSQNPVLYSTNFFRQLQNKISAKHRDSRMIEAWVSNNIWGKFNYSVAYGLGLFRHIRLDRGWNYTIVN